MSFHFTLGGILQAFWSPYQRCKHWCVTLALCDSKASAMQMFLMSSIEEKERLLQPAPVLQPTSWNCRFRAIRIAHQIRALFGIHTIRTERRSRPDFGFAQRHSVPIVSDLLLLLKPEGSAETYWNILEPSGNDFLCRYSNACTENFLLALRL